MSETKEVQLEVGKQVDLEGNNVDQKRVEDARNAFEKFGKELDGKVYLVPGGKTTSDAILDFLENKAGFSAHESLGIVRAHEDVTAAAKSKKKELFVSGLCVEAVAYYVSKATGVGLKEAQEFKDHLFMPINEAMAKIK